MFSANPQTNWYDWDYLMGDPIILNRSISVERYQRLRQFNFLQEGNFKIALHDRVSDKWTKWLTFWDYSQEELQSAYDVHRSLLFNEIVVESDYPTYEENYEAARFVGTMLEDKGYIPHYYYSGSKSIHIHVFLDYSMFTKLPEELQYRLRHRYKHKSKFVNKFIEFIREKLITCWGMHMREFDSDLIRGTHLIRSELSRNKFGYKTFLGYSHFDIPPIAYICNEENRIYPEIGKVKLSKPPEFQDLCEEFLEYTKKKPRAKNNRSLMEFSDENQQLKPCVKYLLSNDFCKAEDGRNRAMFVLSNELKRCYGEEAARTALMDWNQRMGEPITPNEIEYRIRSTKNYTITCKYMSALFRELNMKPPCDKCKNR